MNELSVICAMCMAEIQLSITEKHYGNKLWLLDSLHKVRRSRCAIFFTLSVSFLH